jgi:aryl-alcohol dehydrogenase-like predicted oxidoreductase
VLGTAQLVEPYGIATSRTPGVQTRRTDAHATLLEAGNLGLGAVDTAPGYGKAESVIGTSRWSGPVWTKLDPGLSPDESVRRSLRSLRRSWVDVIFFHDTSQLRRLSKRELADLRSLRGRVVGELAISVYDVHEIVEAFDIIEFRMVQIPVNIFDTRLEESLGLGQLPEGLTYVARSALLQGALSHPAQAAERLPGPLADELRSWLDLCSSLAVLPGEAALTWVLSRPHVDSVIVGAEDAGQLRQLAAWSESERASEILAAIQSTNLWPHSDPRRW